MPTDYRIVIRGRVSDAALDIYRDEFTIDLTDATTTLRGPIIDAAQLQGLVTHLTGTGLELVEVAPTDDRSTA